MKLGAVDADGVGGQGGSWWRWSNLVRANGAGWVLTFDHDRVTVKTVLDITDDWLLEQRRLVGDRMLRYRHERELTQAALGERCGMDRRTVGKLERGLVVADLDQLHRLARGLGVEPAAFFWGS